MILLFQPNLEPSTNSHQHPLSRMTVTKLNQKSYCLSKTNFTPHILFGSVFTPNGSSYFVPFVHFVVRVFLT